MVTRYAEPTPMMDINTTPLIDVLLVLIIMFIITVPPQSHAVKVDLPSGPPPVERPDPVKNKIIVTQGGTILWNGVAVAKPELARLLSATQAMRPVPELHLQPDAGARYALVELLAMTKIAGVEKMGFVGNEEYRAAF